MKNIIPVLSNNKMGEITAEGGGGVMPGPEKNMGSK